MDYQPEAIPEQQFTDRNRASVIVSKRLKVEEWLASHRDDLIQECLIALWKAREDFDPERGNLTTHENSRMNWAIRNYKQSLVKTFVNHYSEDDLRYYSTEDNEECSDNRELPSEFQEGGDVPEYYWDDDDSHIYSSSGTPGGYIDVEDLPHPDTDRTQSMELQDLLEKAGLSPRQYEVAQCWLETGENLETARRMDMTEANVRKLMGKVIKKCQKIAGDER